MAWNRGEDAPKRVPAGANGKRNGSRNKRLIAIAVGTAGAICAICALALLFSREKSPAQEAVRPNKKIADAAPAAKRTTQPQPVDPEAAKHPGCVLSPAGVWQPTNRPWRANATKVHNVHTNWSKSAKANVPYRNAVEQMLLSAVKTTPGMCPPPYMRIPKGDMDKLVEILIAKPRAKEDDTEQQIFDKELINRAKKEMSDFILKGGRPDQFFKHQHDVLQKAYEKRQAAIREVTRLSQEEADPGLAHDFQNEMNKRFKKEGILPIHLDIPSPKEANK